MMRKVYGVAPTAIRVAHMLFCNVHSREAAADQITRSISIRAMTMELFTSNNLAKVRLVHTISNPFVELLLSKLTTLLESKYTSPNGSKIWFNKLPQ